MAHEDLIKGGKGVQVFPTKNHYKSSRTDKKGGICCALAARWIRRSLEGKKGTLEDPKVMGPIDKAILDQYAVETPQRNVDRLEYHRLLAIIPKGSPWDSSLDMMNGLRSLKGFVYYISELIDGDAHAMAFHLSEGEAHFFDPNYGVYKFAKTADMCAAVQAHIEADYPGKRKHCLYSVPGVLPKEAGAAKKPISVQSIIHSSLSGANTQIAYERHQHALTALWLKLCGEEKPNLGQVTKLKELDLELVKPAIKAATMNSRPDQGFDIIFSQLGFALAKDQIKHKSVVVMGTPEGDKALSTLAAKALAISQASGRILIKAEGATIAKKSAELGRSQSLTIAIATLPSQPGPYCFDPLELTQVDAKDPAGLAKRLSAVLADCSKATCYVYAL